MNQANADHSSCRALTCADFNISRWASLDDWRDVADDDVSRDRMAHLTDVDRFVGRSGTLTHYVSDSSFLEMLAHAPDNVSDPRWRCSTWHAHADEFARGSQRAAESVVRLSSAPSLVVHAKRDDGLYTFSVRWRCGAGGIDALNLDDHGPCGECAGCSGTQPSDQANVASWVYFVRADTGGAVKIGRSSAPRARVASLQTANAARLRLLATMPGGPTVERAMHAAFAADRIRPDGEWFRASSSLMAFIREISG